MSSTKKIKALLEERDFLYDEIRRATGAEPRHFDLHRIARECLIDKRPCVNECRKRSLESGVPGASPERYRIAVAVDFSPLTPLSKLYVGNGDAVRYSFTPTGTAQSVVAGDIQPSAVADLRADIGRVLVDAPDAPVIDWANAPEGATHRGGPGGLWYKFDFDADTAAYCPDYDRTWLDVSPATNYLDGSMDDMIARPTGPQEKWSLNGENGAWDYDSLAELIKDNYGHDSDGDGHPASFRAGLGIGDTIYRAIEHKDDPAGFLPDAGQITEIMWDNAVSSDAGEWVDAYPELDEEAAAALAEALEPLKAWARKHCQPDFFTVKDIATHELTAEDVRAAMAQEIAQ